MYAPKLQKSQQGSSSDPQGKHPDHNSHATHGAHVGTPVFLQRSPITSTPDIQREPGDEEEQGFQLEPWPPSVGYRRGPFSMSATTSAAQLGYRHGPAEYSLGYQYGSDIFAGMHAGGFRGRFGINPSEGGVSLGGSYGGFNLGLRGGPSGRFGATFGYGAPLLPMPWALGEQAGAAWQGAYGLGGAFPEFLRNPIEAYGAHREDISSISTFGGSLGRLYEQQQQGQGALPFGVGAGIAYDPVSGVIFNVGMQGSF